MTKIIISGLEVDEYLKEAIKHGNTKDALKLNGILDELSRLPVSVRRICRGAPIAPFNKPQNPRTRTTHFGFYDFQHWLDKVNIWEYWPYLHREMLLSFHAGRQIAITAPAAVSQTISQLKHIADELDKAVNGSDGLHLDETATLIVKYVIIALRSTGRLLAWDSIKDTETGIDERKELLKAEINSTCACIELTRDNKMETIYDENMILSEYVLNEKLKNLTAPGEQGCQSEIHSEFLKWALPLLPDEAPFQFQKQISSEMFSPIEDNHRVRETDEFEIDQSWQICLLSDKSPIKHACKSFQKRLKCGLGVELKIDQGEIYKGGKQIIIATSDELKEFSGKLKNPKDYLIKTTDGDIIVCGRTALGSMFGLFYLESLFFERGAAYLKKDFEIIRHSCFNVRIVMSSLGWMQWPDEYLELLPRYGIDAVFISPYANICGTGRYRGSGHIQNPTEVHNLIKRVKVWGLKVYCPFIDQEDKLGSNIGVDELLEKTIKEFPQIDGLILLTEGFVSTPEAINDFAKKAHELKSELDIIVWNYNGLVSPENNARKVDFSKRCSVDTIQMLTWEKGAKAEFDDEWRYVYDYSISVIGPSKVWAERQLQNEKKKGTKNIYARSDAWNNWQFGTLPYLPFTQQWLDRHDSLVNNQITGTLDSWTYGFTPNFIAEIKNIYCWDNALPREQVLHQIASREFGGACSDEVVKAWGLFSEAIRLVPDTGHGLLCNACAAPLFFDEPPIRVWQNAKDSEMGKNTKYENTLDEYWPYVPQWALLCPDFSNNHNIAEIYCKSYMEYFEQGRSGPGEKGFSLKTFLKYLQKAADKMEAGLIIYRAAAEKSPESKCTKAIKHVLIAEQIRNLLLSDMTILEFEDIRFKLFQNPTANRQLIDRAYALLKDELVRVSDFMAIIKKDSRMGFESEADYFYTPYILQEKIALLNDIINRQIPGFIKEKGL